MMLEQTTGDRATGVSLWLTPEEAAYERLAARIDALALRHGSPRFPPHLTLLGGIGEDAPSALAAAMRLASGTPPLTVRLVTAVVRDEYFRRLVLEAAPTDALTAARARATAAFALPAQSFEPHLSLLYGRAAASPADAGMPFPLVFTCREIAVWRTQGPVAEWRPLGRLVLGGSGT